MLISTAQPKVSAGDPAFAAVLQVVRERTGVDFTRYRPPTVMRRLVNRMLSAGEVELSAYLERLRADSGEASRLLERLTIKVSRFYRNAATFDALRSAVIPELRAARGRLRVWSAGCGQGEEAYTIAMLLEEAGAEGVVEASDVDPCALRAAEAGRYPQQAFSELPSELLERYCQRIGPDYEVAAALRRRVRFSWCDLTSGQPASQGPGFDLICCRNVLIYFERKFQDRAFSLLAAELGPGGYLCLGEAEWPPSAAAGSLQGLGGDTHVFRAVGAARNRAA